MDLKDMMAFKPRLPSLVCSIGEGGTGDPGAGGGGAGGAPGAGGTGDPPAFDPEAFKSEIKDFTIRAVNGAISTHLTRALDSKLQENNNGLLSQFKEMLAAQAPAGDPPPNGSGNTDVDTAIKNATAPLLKQLEEQRAANERAAAQAKAERESRMRQEEETALVGALTAAGVAGPLASAAVNLLHGNLERDESGAIHFVCKETGPTGPYDERVTITEGVARFLKTDDGKHFLPARPVSGGGNRGGNAPGIAPGQQSDTDFVASMLGELGIGV